jgi:uncharacterized membrane protein
MRKNMWKSGRPLSELDLVVVLAVTAGAVVFLFAPIANSTVIRSIVGTFFLLLVPGYSFSAALFPGRDDIDNLTRCALSLGMSVAFVTIAAEGLNYTSWGIRLAPLALCATLITIACTLIAYHRRFALPKEKRFVIDFSAVTSLRHRVFPESESSLDRKLTAILMIIALVSVPTVAYVITSPKPAETNTELYISPVDGKAGDYSTDFQLGQQQAVTVSVANHEGVDTTYSLVTTLENGTRNQTLDSEKMTLANGQVWEKDINLKPDQAGTHMKIAFLLYRDDNVTTPYREVYLWVNVTKPA